MKEHHLSMGTARGRDLRPSGPAGAHPAGASRGDAPVSREALAKPESAGRKYVSPFRQNQGQRTRQAIVDAALAFIEQGNFRPKAREVAEIAGCHKSAVTRHFGSIDGLYRLIAREHATAVIRAAEQHDVSLPYDHAKVAWLIMVGRKREPS
jgi:AcrR family transcriptional regulator